MVSKEAETFAQALANGEASVDDVVYILEHMGWFLKDKAPEVEKWLPRSLDEVADEVIRAEHIATTEKELDYEA